MKKLIIIGLAALFIISIALISYLSLSHGTQPQTSSEQNVGQAVKLININTASQAELQSLKGIGKVLALRIIEGRPYSEPAEILKVKGIRPKKLAKIKDFITVN